MPDSPTITPLPPYPQEQALIEYLPSMDQGNILCTSLGRMQFAIAAASHNPGSNVTCHFIDMYRAELAKTSVTTPLANLTVECTPDFPEKEIDIVAIPTSMTGEAELTRDLLQQGHQRLLIGGRMITTTNNTKDTWLHKQMQWLFSDVQRLSVKQGILYTAVKKAPLKKLKDFSSEFAFRDQGTLLKAISRPSVFSHRKLDLGARRLINAMDIQPGFKVLDVGCGWGAVALAAAIRGEDVQVHAIDSNARAIACTQQNAALNNLTNIHTTLTASGQIDIPGSYDLVLANPPYYADFRIAGLFATIGANALRPGGRILFVTKLPQWYKDNLEQWFTNIKIEEHQDYLIISAQKP